MKYVLTLSLFLCIGIVMGQQNKLKYYKKNPVWIEMIKDPNVNYFEAIKAYETFWKNKEKPLEEDELIGQTKGDASKEEKMESRKKMRENRREKQMYRKYGLECKKFEHWKIQVKPYVQADGHIISNDEQLKMWEQKQ